MREITPTEQHELELMRSAPMNCWIALSADETRIIASGSSYDEVVQRSIAAGEPDALLMKTPRQWGAYLY